MHRTNPRTVFSGRWSRFRGGWVGAIVLLALAAAGPPPATPAATDLADWTADVALPAPRTVGPAAAAPTQANPATRLSVSQAYGRLPLHFEANRGQTKPEVKFLARAPGHTVFLTATEAVLVLSPPRPAGPTSVACRDGGSESDSQLPGASSA